MTNVLEVRDLVHRYGETLAVAGVDLTVSRGECVALLGPNGAGKTTLVRNVIGLIHGQEGTVRVAGRDPRNAVVRRNIGVVQQEVGFPRVLTVWDVVSGAAARSGLPRETARAAIDEMGLDGLERRRADAISGGQQQRLQLAMGLVSDPRLLVLDEPTVGLDVNARREFWRSIDRRRSTGAGVLVTTHLVEEAASVADRVVVIDRGRIVAEGSPDQLRRTLPDRRIVARTATSLPTIRSLDGVVSAELDGEHTRITAQAAEAVVRTLLELDPGLADLTVATASLDEVLISMTRRQEVAA